MHHPFGVKNNTFYIYLCIFENLHIIFPFTDFKCEILRVKNVSPSWFYYNCCVFTKTFCIMSENFGHKSHSRCFIFFFTIQKGWVREIGCQWMLNRARLCLTFSNFPLWTSYTIFWGWGIKSFFLTLRMKYICRHVFPLYLDSDPSFIKDYNFEKISSLKKSRFIFLILLCM